MKKEDIALKLKQIIIKSIGLKKTPDEIEGKDLIAELGINSVDAVEILVWVENTFKFQIPDEDLNADLIRSLDGFAEYIYSHANIQEG